MVFPFLEGFLLAVGSPLDPPDISPPVWTVVMGLGGLLGGGILVLTFAKLWRETFGKPASISLDIGAHPKEDKSDKGDPATKRFELDLSGLVKERDFEEHKKAAEIRARGLEEQISGLRHEWREEVQPILTGIESRDETAQEWRLEVGRKVDDSALKLAAVKQQADMIQTSQHNMDVKIDRLIERHIPPLSPARS